MQTLAGLALDTDHQRLAEKVAPAASSRVIQYLLNTFVLLNVLHFLTLLALGRLYRRRKAAAVLIANTRGSSGEIVSVSYHQNQLGSPKSAGYTENTEHAEDTIPSPPSAGAGFFSSATSPDHTPLLSDARRSYFTQGTIEYSRRSHANPPTTKVVGRGELFTGLSAALVVFAWVLFLVTAWLKLRSKAERGGSISPALGLLVSD